MRRSKLWLLTLVAMAGANPSAWAGSEEQEWIFPIVVNGGPPGFRYQTTFSFFNFSTTAGDVSIRGVPDDLEAGGILFCPVPVAILPPTDSRFETAAPMAGHGAARIVSSGETAALFTGWARAATRLNEGVAAVAEISILTGAPQPCGAPGVEPSPRVDVGERPSFSIVGSVQVTGVRPALEFAVETTVTETRETGFAIVNPNTVPADVSFELFNKDGTPIVSDLTGRSCSSRFRLEPGERRVDFARVLAPQPTINITFPCDGGLPPNFQGTARIVADRPIAVGALHVLFPEGKIVNAKVTRR